MNGYQCDSSVFALFFILFYFQFFFSIFALSTLVVYFRCYEYYSIFQDNYDAWNNLNDFGGSVVINE